MTTFALPARSFVSLPETNRVSANPAISGPVLLDLGGRYVTAAPELLDALQGQLAWKGSDGYLYTRGRVPQWWPSGVEPGYRLVLRQGSGGLNVLWLPPTAPRPKGLGTNMAAYVELGHAGDERDTILFEPKAPCFS